MSTNREQLGDDSGAIYIIGEVDLQTPVKIGMATTALHAHKRKLTFATGNFRPLEALAVIPVEHARWVEFRLHRAFAPWSAGHKNSTEWFDVRHLVTKGWDDLVRRALAGEVPNAGPMPDVPDSASHHVDHVHGRPRHLRAVCSCGWVSAEGSVYVALDRYRAHALG